ncbi:type II toxin-antitoxin system RelE/ParE family toxin [Aquidulcibacter sp.]|uniref:type II toxin-antitoxin system RelE/ParE family toxin n=1 Tax=Aquidulcibacter sp. TaxID=2052990 RepID=UPI0037C17EED
MVYTPISRAFKTIWFAKAAKKARIDDDELWNAIEQARLGQADDLGGAGVQETVGGQSVSVNPFGKGRHILGLFLPFC